MIDYMHPATLSNQELEYGFIEELGLSDKDFSDHYIAEKKLAEEEKQGEALQE